MEGDRLRIGIDGMYEPNETAFVRKILRAGQTFVDIGAHIGYYSVMAARIVGPLGSVLAFEPNPENFEALKQNVGRFGDVVKTFQAAVSDQCGKSKLYFSETNSGDHRLFETENWKSIDVDVLTIDSLNVGPVDFIKIDVQGNELRVIQGASETLRRSPNAVGIVEFSPEHLRLAGTKPMDMISTLKELGFRISMRNGDKFIPIPKTDMSKRKHHVNLIIYRRSI